MKLCGKCQTEKSDDEFSKRGEILQAWCKSCVKEYDKERFQRIKPERYKQVKARNAKITDWVRNMKNGPCVDCGNTFHPVAMDWDHLGDKEYDIADMVRLGFSKKKILQEIKKCELVCSNCHRVRTFERRDLV